MDVERVKAVSIKLLMVEQQTSYPLLELGSLPMEVLEMQRLIECMLEL